MSGLGKINNNKEDTFESFFFQNTIRKQILTCVMIKVHTKMSKQVFRPVKDHVGMEVNNQICNQVNKK
jgi:hypothetical protein